MNKKSDRRMDLTPIFRKNVVSARGVCTLLVGVFFLIIMAYSHASLPGSGGSAPRAILFCPKTHFDAKDIGVIVNDADPLSVRIGRYYRARRGIPADNMVHVRFNPDRESLTSAEFKKIKVATDAATPNNVQAYALTWASPYRVDCMSMTTAFAAGFDKAFCAERCDATKQNNYFNSESRTPFRDLHIRPTMALAGRSFADVRRLIDRGIASDHTFPTGTAYLLSTRSKARNVRAFSYPSIVQHMRNLLNIQVVDANFITNKSDVLFYFTGIAKVPKLTTNQFVPGAVADHLTSMGGVFGAHNPQMSSLRWLEAGATASYGTVVEPCNRPQKFPHPGIVISRYRQGETVIEAYWKSVMMPGQGLFIGEPLANPYSGTIVFLHDSKVVMRSPALASGGYMLLSSHQVEGPYETEITDIDVSHEVQKVELNNFGRRFYKLSKLR